MKSDAPAGSAAAPLEEAEAAFQKGDFAEVRRLTGSLATDLDHETRKRAKALAARVAVDPIAVAVWVVSALFLGAVAVRYLGGS